MPNRVLIVDDDELILSCFERALASRFTVETALGAAEGIKAITDRGPYAVVMSDMRMPGLSGIDFLARVKQESPDTVRLLLTGNSEVIEADDAVRAGVVSMLLQKPVPMDALIDVLKEALAQHDSNLHAEER